MTRKRFLALCGLTALCSLAAVSQEAKPEGKRTLAVQLNYTGAGHVDEKHKIFVVLWDSPDFAQGQAMPVALLPATAKDGVVTFSDVQKVPAYVSAAYDPNGGWDGQSGPPPSGSSLGMYSKGGAPEPIDIVAGKSVNVTLSFDDSFKKP